MTPRVFVWSISMMLAASACDDAPKTKTEPATPAEAKEKPAEGKPAVAKVEAPEAEPGKAGAVVDHGGFTVAEVGDDGDLKAILADHAAKAKAKGQTAHVEFWADWCGPCKDLEASMEDERMKQAFAGVYLIRMNFDHWSPKLEGTGMESASIPVFFELDDAGAPTGRTIDGGAWGENIPENMAPPLSAYFHHERS